MCNRTLTHRGHKLYICDSYNGEFIGDNGPDFHLYEKSETDTYVHFNGFIIKKVHHINYNGFYVFKDRRMILSTDVGDVTPIELSSKEEIQNFLLLL